MVEYTLEEIQKQILDIEGKYVDISLIHETVFTKHWQDVFPERAPDDITADQFQERAVHFYNVASKVVDRTVVNLEACRRVKAIGA